MPRNNRAPRNGSFQAGVQSRCMRSRSARPRIGTVPGPFRYGSATTFRATATNVESRKVRKMNHTSIASLALLQPYRTTGGLATSDHAAMLLGRYRDQPISQLARWIVARKILSFESQGERWVPLFQFDLRDMSPRPQVADVLAELGEAFDELEAAAWFARPCRWLQGDVPLVMVEIDPGAVRQAALMDRYIACAARKAEKSPAPPSPCGATVEKHPARCVSS